MSFVARDYQEAAVDALFGYFAEFAGNPVIAMPTGTGKSVVIARALQRIYNAFPGERVMVLTHVKELIEQNHAKLLSMWPGAPAGVYSAGLKRREVDAPITFAGIASVAKRAAHFGHVGLVFVDEAHLVSPKETTMYQAFFDGLRLVNPKLKIVALTATPWRLGHGHIAGEGSLFTDVCFDLTTTDCFNWLLDEGYLCHLIPRTTETRLSTDGVHVRGGEFVASELAAAVDKQPVTAAALSEVCELAKDRFSWLVFCAGVEHAVHVAEELQARGISCRAVHSDMPEKEREQAIADWKAGRIRALTNNNVLTTGIDHPALDCIVMLRPTASTVLWVQMLGRGTRPFYASGYDLTTRQGRLEAIAASHKQNCLVLDFARNTPRLGPINDPVIPRKRGEKAGEAPVKLCPACGTYNHASARHCMLCGTEFPAHGPKLVQTAGTDELIKQTNYDVQTVRVDHVTYAVHSKLGKPPSVKVSYYCGLRRFQEFVCFEHEDGFSRRRARDWWNARQPGTNTNALPATTAAAMQLVEHLNAPTHLRVWLNKKPYAEILSACFDGTDFGAATDSGHRPDTNAEQAMPAPHSPPVVEEDDIPF